VDNAPVTPHLISGALHKEARDARARAWAYAFECFNRRVSKEAAPESRPDDARKDVQDAGTYSHCT
jgi:hypothetical protein